MIPVGSVQNQRILVEKTRNEPFEVAIYFFCFAISPGAPGVLGDEITVGRLPTGMGSNLGQEHHLGLQTVHSFISSPSVRSGSQSYI